MPFLTIGGTEYAVADGASLDWQNIDHLERAFSGKVRSTVKGAGGRARVWSVTTDLLTESEGDTLEAALTAAGTVSAAGDFIGSTVTCKALNVSRRDGPLADMVALSFELHEVFATTAYPALDVVDLGALDVDFDFAALSIEEEVIGMGALRVGFDFADLSIEDT